MTIIYSHFNDDSPSSKNLQSSLSIPPVLNSSCLVCRRAWWLPREKQPPIFQDIESDHLPKTSSPALKTFSLFLQAIFLFSWCGFDRRTRTQTRASSSQSKLFCPLCPLNSGERHTSIGLLCPCVCWELFLLFTWFGFRSIMSAEVQATFNKIINFAPYFFNSKWNFSNLYTDWEESFKVREIFLCKLKCRKMAYASNIELWGKEETDNRGYIWFFPI